MKKILGICLASAILATATIQTGCVSLWPKPKEVVDKVWAIDSSTPPQYNKHHGGFLKFVGDKGLITKNLRVKYNILIALYGKQFLEVKAVLLARDSGIENYVDEHGNELFLIDQEHLVYFIILKKWSNELRPTDK
jgi:hypothetical protein